MPLEPCNARSTSHFVQPRGSYSMKQVCVCVKKWNRSDCLCAMDPEPRTDHGEALSDISPAVVHQQGMSPNTAGAAAAIDAHSGAGDTTTVVAGNRGAEQDVAVRTMAVAVATEQSPRNPVWTSVDAGFTERVEASQARLADVSGQYNQMNAAQASWSVMATRRTAPAWIQRLGAFFQEMRGQQQNPWQPSPMGTPPQRMTRAAGSPESEGGRWAAPPLLSPEQQDQFRRMEQRAPHLHGQALRDRQEGSSGGSTYEAVQEEVKRQLRGVVSQLEASRREAQDLRQELEHLRAEGKPAMMGPQQALPEPTGPPTTLGGHLASGMSTTMGVQATSSMPPASGVQASSSMPQVSGVHATSSMPSVSGVHATSSIPLVSGIQASSSMPTVSGVQASSSMPTVSGVQASSSMPTVSGLQTAGVHARTGCASQGAAKDPNLQAATGVGVGGGASDPMSRLLEGLEKVIKGGKPEELSKAAEAPKLPELSDSSSVDFGDWLYLMDHVMSDLSASSAEWWRILVQDAQEFYDRYQAADQFARLSLKPTPSPELGDQRWSRLDRRGAATLLAATPDDVKRELVAARTKSTLEVLARLMVIYRPGSAQEKGQLLRRIENPDPSSTSNEAVEGLRQWLRHYQRARDLKLTTPDPSVMPRGLDGLVKKPVQEAPDVAFRMNLLRYHLKVDFSPSEESVLAVHRALLAEFEQMGFRKKARTTQDSGVQGPKVRAVEAGGTQPTAAPMPTTPSTSPKGASRPCRFYTTDEGCRRGKACKYEHSMKDLSKAERRDRCYECGAKGHQAAACPTKKEVQQRAVAASDSPASSTGGTGGRKGTTARGQRGSEAGESTQSTTASTTTATPTVPAETPVQGVPVEQLIEDAQKLMKAFMEQKTTPHVQVFRVEEAAKRDCGSSPALREFLRQNEELVNMNRMGLLDSGATHPLRPKTTRGQGGTMDNVNVTLAGENQVQMAQNKAGTILGGQNTQPIVPLGTLVKALGYEFSWDRRGCRLRHPDKKEVRVYTRSTCPEVMQCDALRLIAELEEAKLTETMNSLAQLKASVTAAREYRERSWRDQVRDYMDSGSYEDGVKAVMCAPFMHHVPMRDQLQVVAPMPKDENEAWQWMKKFPMNRANRRRLWQTREWTVHMFAGGGVKNDPLRDLPGLVEVDAKRGWDLNDDKVYGVFLWMAKEGRLNHIVGDPPAGTFSPWHYKPEGANRKRAVRSTWEPWGLREGLTPEESSKVVNENVMLQKMVWLWLCAEAAKAIGTEGEGQHRVGFCLEYPEDPHNYMPEGDHRAACVSVWRTEFMKEFIKETGLRKFQFEQGALGHMFRRPTCCLSNLGLGIHGLKDQRAYVAADTKEVDQSTWPHGFRITLADAIHEWKSGESTVVVKKAMSQKELDEWKAHVERGHWPYRRDCSVCLTASGTGRPARRVVHRDAYVMSLDIAGPFAEKGKDEVRGKKYRFVLAATYLFPKTRDVPEDAPIPNEEEAEEFLREEEEEPEVPEPPEDPECDAQEEEWKKKVADLRKPMELQMLRFCVPLERHTGKEILECIQDLYVQLRAMGLPLTRIHGDRAREFRVKPVRKWCRDRDIYQTFTEGLAPTQNAVAESHVKWLKGKARVHLNEMELDKEFWPCAMKHACHQHNARQMGTKAASIKFGSVVWVKSKKDRGPFDPKWERGKYMGPADDVREGHVVRLDDGLWLRTLHMRTVRDDEVEWEDEEHVVDLIEPTMRVRGKTKLSDPEMRAIRKHERNVVVKELLESKIWDSPQAKVERPQMKEGEVWEGAAYINLGAYQHGGITSITRATEKFNKEAVLAARLLAIDHPGSSFTSVALVKNAVMPVHRDSFNHKKAMNLISPLKVTKGSCVWQELKEGDEFRGNYHAMRVDEREVSGQKISVEVPTRIRPDRLHAPLRGEDGDRIVVIGYTVSKWEKLQQGQCDDLEELGFVLPEREPVMRMLEANGRRRPPTPPIPEHEDLGAAGPPTGTTAAPPTGATNTVMTSGASFLGPGSSSESTLPRPVSEDRMDVSSGTPAPHTLQSSSSGSRSGQREYLPEMGGERLDSMVVPGGRVELRLKWAIKYIPDLSNQGEQVVMTSTPFLPLAHDEEERMRSRVTWLSEFVEEERKIRARQAERGEYATQRERQLFYKLDDAIDYMNEILCLSHQAREQAAQELDRAD